MGRKPCCSKEGLNKGAWTSLEDKILIAYIRAHGEGGWRNLPKRAGLKRCGKSCRLRWLNYLRPDIKRGNISDEEEELIIRLHNLLGNRWSLIAGRLPGRTDNEIKNYWNTTLTKKMKTKSSSSPSHRQHSRSKKLANEEATAPAPPAEAATLFQAIRTKARRCTKVVLINETPSVNPNDQNLGFENHETRPWEDNFFNIEDDEFPTKNENFAMESDVFLASSDKEMLHEWTENENTTLDLDFLSIFLDSDDWSAHRNLSSCPTTDVI